MKDTSDLGEGCLTELALSMSSALPLLLLRDEESWHPNISWTQNYATETKTKNWDARWQRADKRHSEAILLPSHTDCGLSQHIAGLGSPQLRASTFAPRVTASQLGTALIDVLQLRESKHRHDNVFVSALLLPMLQRWTGAVLQYTQMSPSRSMGSQALGSATKYEFNSLGKKGADF